MMGHMVSEWFGHPVSHEHRQTWLFPCLWTEPLTCSAAQALGMLVYPPERMLRNLDEV